MRHMIENKRRRLLWLIAPCALLLAIFARSARREEVAGEPPPRASVVRGISRPSLAATRSPGIRGKVVSTSGAPIAGASVCAVCATCDITISPPAHCSASGSAGEFALEDMPGGSFVVSAVRAGYATGMANAGAPLEVSPRSVLENVVIELARGEYSLTGVVLDATGGPIVQARVQVAKADDRVRPFVELATDEEGRFAVSVPPGPVTIRADAPGYAPSLAFRTAPSYDVELTLAPGSAIAGTVVEAATGEPVAGAAVAAAGSLASTLLAPVISGEDGRFELAGLAPGTYGLSATADNHRGRTEQAVHVGFAERVDGVVLRVASGTLVTGRVLIAGSDEPCGEGRVRVGPAESSSPDAYATYANQRMELSALGPIEPSGLVKLRGLNKGRYQVMVECTGHVYREGPLTLDVVGQDLTATWRVARGLGLVVHVSDKLGKPVPHAKLTLEFPAGTGSRRRLVGFPIDGEGRGDLLGSLNPGRYVLHPDDSYGAAPLPVELVPGDGAREVTLTLPGTSSLRVQVRTGAGAPVEEVNVIASALTSEGSADADVVRRATAIGSGQFLVQALPPGAYTVKVDDGVNPAHDAEGPGGKIIQLRPGEEVLASATLRCAAALSGVVRDESGAPVGDVWVRAFQAQERGLGAGLSASEPRKILSESDGQFLLKGLCADASYTLRAEDYGGALGELKDVRPGEGLQLTVRRGGELRGVVLLPQGQPATDYTLSVHHGSTERSLGVRIRSQDGSFAIEGIPAGDVRLEVLAPGLSASTTAVVSPGQRVSGLMLRLAGPPEAAPATEG